MYFSSKFAAGLAVALAITLWTFGVPTLQARVTQESCVTCPVVQERCLTCPIDPKEVEKAQHEAAEDAERAQKEADHAAHEAAEDCERNQRAYDKAQHDVEEAQEKLSEKVAKANEFGGMCPAPVAQAEPEPEPEVMRSKPVEPEPPKVEAPPPAPTITPTPTPPVTIELIEPVVEEPKQLPRTASSQVLIALIGLISTTGAVTGFLRAKRRGKR